MNPTPSILVVEDDHTLRAQLCDVIEDMGFAPVDFAKAAPALDHLRSAPGPELMLLDLHLPDMNGVEVVRATAELEQRPAIILLTAHAKLQTAIECLRQGAEDYLTKPFDLDLLTLTIERVLERQKLRRNSELLQRLLTDDAAGFLPSAQLLKTLAETLRSQITPDDFPMAVERLFGATHQMLRSEHSFLHFGRLDKALHLSLPATAPAGSDTARMRAVMDWVIESGNSVVHGTAAQACPRLLELRPSPGSVFFPISNSEAVLGGLHLSRLEGGHRFSASELHLIELLCAELSVLHTSAMLYQNCSQMTIGAITALANTLKCKDEMTAQHAQRSHVYIEQTLDDLGLSKSERDIIAFAMRLHDIGKIRVPDAILNKPGPLTAEEWNIMKMHPVWGYEILNAEGMLADVAVLVRHHHERFDGTGYPDRLAGSGIPMGARLMCIVDSFDAMISNRPYREALPLEEAMEEIRRNLGTQFCPEIGEVFLHHIERNSVMSVA